MVERLTLTVTEGTMEKVRMFAEYSGLELDQVIDQAIEELLEHHGEKIALAMQSIGL